MFQYRVAVVIEDETTICLHTYQYLTVITWDRVLFLRRAHTAAPLLSLILTSNNNKHPTDNKNKGINIARRKFVLFSILEH
jgi:hypothetical protein